MCSGQLFQCGFALAIFIQCPVGSSGEQACEIEAFVQSIPDMRQGLCRGVVLYNIAGFVPVSEAELFFFLNDHTLDVNVLQSFFRAFIIAEGQLYERIIVEAIFYLG